MAVDLHVSSQVLADLMATDGVGNWDIGAFMWVLRHTSPNGVFENRIEVLMQRDRYTIPKARIQKMVSRLRQIGLMLPLTMKPYRKGEYVVWPMAGGRAAKMGHGAPLMVEWVKLWESAIEYAVGGESGAENGTNAKPRGTERKVGELPDRPGKHPGVYGIGGGKRGGNSKTNFGAGGFGPDSRSEADPAEGIQSGGSVEPAPDIEAGEADFFVGQFDSFAPFSADEQPIPTGQRPSDRGTSVSVVSRRASWSRRK